MMAQYLEIKAGHEDALLFYRMGDFYELFFDDAKAAAAALDIALTHRGKHLGEDIPMCGVPAHSAESYLLTLIRKGFRVAVAEQMEDPAEAKKRGAKAVVKRAVTRLVTPGTLTEDALLEARRHNYLAAVAEVRGEGAVAWVDVSTGDFHVAPVAGAARGPLLARLAPREVLVPEDAADEPGVEEAGGTLTPLARSSFDSTAAAGRVAAALGVGTLDGFGSFSRPELSAMGAIVAYLELTQRGRMPRLRPPVQERPGGAMQIDAATRRNLELTRSLTGGRGDTLLAAIDRTVTGPGARLLETRLTAPLTELAAIRARADQVSDFVADRGLAAEVRDGLRAAPDMERALSRLALDRGGPRDLGAVRDGLAAGAALAERLTDELAPETVAARARLTGLEELAARLAATLRPDLPTLARDGGFIAAGVDDDLDEARRLRDEGRSVIAAMQAEFAAATGIASLKVRHNNVLGYFIEVTATHGDKMLADTRFIHRQTTASALRFTTPE
ncbi:MAG: DNA mismatch repair protein MutS, partial [Pseudomonadota bacterium]